MTALDRAIRANRSRYYDALKAHNESIWREAIERGQALALSIDVPLSKAAEVEWAFVAHACELLGVKPKHGEPFDIMGELRGGQS